MIRSFFRHPDGMWPNLVAISYTFMGYVAGIGMLAAEGGVVNVLGVLLVAHTLIFSAYLIHEFAHGTVFKTASANTWGGVFMSWLNGSCYARFADLRLKHMRHHIDRADVITFDFKAFLRRRAAWVRKLTLALEWAYFPAVEFIMRGYVMALPFVVQERAPARRRILAVLAIRLAAFGLLAWISWKALALYAVAYLLFVTVLRFADAYQHTYDAIAILGAEGATLPETLRDRDYEQENTYSNLVSVRHPWLNLVLLNFAYHNAHHEKPTVPWYRLPALHRELFGEDYEQVIPMQQLLPAFHHHRTARVLSEDYGAVGAGATKTAGFIGAVGVSFLTAV